MAVLFIFAGPPLCTGCGQPILDQFIIRVQGRLWHATCLRCSACNTTLTGTCFARGSQVFCQEDFIRLFGARCAGCGEGIPPSDAVRRAHENIYHLTCFTCVVCDQELRTGEEFFLRDDGRLVCRPDYDRAKSEDEDQEVDMLRRSRTYISEQQADSLTKAFNSCSRPSREMRDSLAADIDLDARVIQIWFQNRRAKSRRDRTDSFHQDPVWTGSSVDMTELPVGFPLPIVNEAYPRTRPIQTTTTNQHPTTSTSGETSATLPWSFSPEMWSVDFVPPNVDLEPSDIKDGEVCPNKRSFPSWAGQQQLTCHSEPTNGNSQMDLSWLHCAN
ncbi:LIM/homeobox protein Lhx3-like [Gigantopelta aegis]|uniref:LIM/homeobox protein Lhx3-like n=1 Tax=Gigantopelta aegis TaxID=1735272 RepID=UPI001B88B302|nr:LIM/homeobox protein Lhx3-like [Gigantopelta aegis]